MPIVALLVTVAVLLGACRGDGAGAAEAENTEARTETSAQAQAAIEALSAQLAETPEDASLYARRGQIYADNDVLDLAIADFESSIRYDSNVAEVWHALADAQLDNLRSREALATMIYAGSQFKDRVPTLLKLAEFQLILRRHDDAVATLERAGRADPTEGEVFFMLGQVLEDQDSTATAEPIQAYERAVELNPDLLDAWLRIAELYARRGNPIAERYYETATEIDRSNPLPARMLADYYAAQDRLADAVAAYDRAIALDPQYAEALYNSGLVLLDMDSVARAQRQFELATQVAPDYVEARYYLGVALELLGNGPGARRAYEEALRMAPGFKLAEDAIARLGTN